jgi:hypothetical protein
MRLCAAIVVVIAAARAAALAGPVTCSTSFQGYCVCSDPGGYMSNRDAVAGQPRAGSSQSRRFPSSSILFSKLTLPSAAAWRSPREDAHASWTAIHKPNRRTWPAKADLWPEMWPVSPSRQREPA